jgi:hypothetical protein
MDSLIACIFFVVLGFFFFFAIVGFEFRALHLPSKPQLKLCPQFLFYLFFK